MSPIKQVVPFVLMPQEMIFYGVYLLFPVLFWVNVGRPEPSEAQWEGSLENPAWARLAWHFHYFQKSRKILSSSRKDIFPTDVFLFYIIGMVGGLICDECVCIECVIRQMFSFPDHSGCMSSMALMFHSQWYLSLTIFTNAFPSQKMKCLFLPHSVPAIFISTFIFPALTSLWPNILNYWW